MCILLDLILWFEKEINCIKGCVLLGFWFRLALDWAYFAQLLMALSWTVTEAGTV
jgi:hypothetical protein